MNSTPLRPRALEEYDINSISEASQDRPSNPGHPELQELLAQMRGMREEIAELKKTSNSSASPAATPAQQPQPDYRTPSPEEFAEQSACGAPSDKSAGRGKGFANHSIHSDTECDDPNAHLQHTDIYDQDWSTAAAANTVSPPVPTPHRRVRSNDPGGAGGIGGTHSEPTFCSVPHLGRVSPEADHLGRVSPEAPQPIEATNPYIPETAAQPFTSRTQLPL